MKKYFEHFKTLTARKSMRYGVLASVLPTVAAISCFAEGETTPVTASDFSSLMTSLTSQISVTTIVAVLGIGVAAAAGFAFMWWGARKLIGMLMAAFQKGKVKI